MVVITVYFPTTVRETEVSSNIRKFQFTGYVAYLEILQGYCSHPVTTADMYTVLEKC